MTDPAEEPLALLLLPEPLERFEHAEHARDLLRAPRVLALEPPRMSWGRIARLPDSLALGIGVRQARRLRLPGRVRVALVYDAGQLALAQGLQLRWEGTELWRAEAVVEATAQASFAFAPADAAGLGDDATADAFTRNEPLWERLEALGIAEFRD
ncbi:hypothetical protein Q5424_11065 [Conexibacter sp. JD483]|uniref:hypothetical protein n=1 Tax=unclassified Conexibacter TaxID=2627773 RepID=UPI002723A9CB|nr:MULTISPECIES: hypothetical protein [unclassified Conexibacter]MDO8186349.1 hypothetical protein [Conexibacter sp. CPCC 205706]MDO8197554.1 hypothetical protein [Conexibacter sp. CPCC 205762]MDR9369624.1 hypothetical protein [Conexibacter sp. JD483]